jgi:rhodanese-related sulfurtransferase
MKTTIKQLSLIGTLAVAMLLSPFSNFANSHNNSSLSLENTENPTDPKPIYLTNSKYRMETLELNNRILAKKNLPIVLNVSTLEHTPIKGSIHIGDMEKHSYADLKLALGKTPKSKEIVVYCGCCTLDNCERVEKAFDLLRANGYTNVKVLNLPEGFYPDWKGKGYATESYELE